MNNSVLCCYGLFEAKESNIFGHDLAMLLLHTLLYYSNGIFPPADVETTTLSNLIPALNTGDLVLFSGATNSGAMIKFFDHSEFSHIGIVSSISWLRVGCVYVYVCALL